MASLALQKGSSVDPAESASEFKLAAESDISSMLLIFLPSDYQIITTETGAAVVLSTEKQVNFRLSNSAILIEGGTMIFWIDRQTGKKCYLIGARKLSITWGENPNHWKWTSDPSSRFSEVAELVDVFWLEIRGKIETQMLSPKTSYAAFLVFKLTEEPRGFESVNASVRFIKEDGNETGDEGNTVYLNPPSNPSPGVELPHKREDGWMEVKLGEFSTDTKPDVVVEMGVFINDRHRKSGLIVEGIEVRPTQTTA